MKNRIRRIAVDGGPCSGKTTWLVKASERLITAGFYPFVVPEAATVLIGAGITPAAMGNEAFQGRIVQMQLRNEDTVARLAKAQKCSNPILLCDRALLSGAAYFPEAKSEHSLAHFQEKILSPHGWTIERAGERYEGVVLLETAAYGAEEFYTHANNSARTETLEQARERHDRSVRAWLGHPHVAEVRNTYADGMRINFDSKMLKAEQELCRFLGIPVPLETEEKFLVKSFNPKRLPVHCETVEIEQTYLVSKIKREERVRMRRRYGHQSYIHTFKMPARGISRYELEEAIPLFRYKRFLARKDPFRSTIRKTRYCFMWQSQYFELDVFHGILDGLVLLERERTEENTGLPLPPFIDIDRDVTLEKVFSGRELAGISERKKKV